MYILGLFIPVLDHFLTTVPAWLLTDFTVEMVWRSNALGNTVFCYILFAHWKARSKRPYAPFEWGLIFSALILGLLMFHNFGGDQLSNGKGFTSDQHLIIHRLTEISFYFIKMMLVISISKCIKWTRIMTKSVFAAVIGLEVYWFIEIIFAKILVYQDLFKYAFMSPMYTDANMTLMERYFGTIGLYAPMIFVFISLFVLFLRNSYIIHHKSRLIKSERPDDIHVYLVAEKPQSWLAFLGAFFKIDAVHAFRPQS